MFKIFWRFFRRSYFKKYINPSKVTTSQFWADANSTWKPVPLPHKNLVHVPEPLEQMVLSIFVWNNDGYFFYWSTVSRLVASINNAKWLWKRMDFSPGWQKSSWSLFFAFKVVRFVRTLLSWIGKLFQRLNVNNRWLLISGSCGRCSGSADFRFRLFDFCLFLVEFCSWFWDFEESEMEITDKLDVIFTNKFSSVLSQRNI